MPVTIREDLEDAFDWDRIEETTDDAGEVTLRHTWYDDGVQRHETFDDRGNDWTIIADGDFLDLADGVGVAGAYEWRMIVERRDHETGALLTEETILDNNVWQTTGYEGGARIAYVEVDAAPPTTILDPEAAPGVHPWYSRWWFYDPLTGDLTQHGVQQDNATTRVQYYTEGALTQIVSRDVPTDYYSFDEERWQNRYTWQTQTANLDPATGDITDRTTVFDNGIVQTETFVDGELKILEQEDNPGTNWVGVRNWDSVRIEYDLPSFYGRDGQVASKEIRYDNGQRYIEYTEDGVLAWTVEADGDFLDADDGIGVLGVADWRIIETHYDLSTGDVPLRITIFDNDLTRYEGFTNGSLHVVYEFDGLEINRYDPVTYPGENAWHERWWNYDTTTGELTEHGILYDNGTQRTQRYTDGILTEIVQSDTRPAWAHDPGVWTGIHDWESISTLFDPDTGAVTERSVVYDSGIIRTDTYSNGTLSSTVQLDNPMSPEISIYDWYSVGFVYDANGQIAQRITEYDNGDAKTEEYVNGTRTVLHRIDGAFDHGGGTAPNNHPWQEIAIGYNATTGVIESRNERLDDGTSKFVTYTDGRVSSIRQTDGNALGDGPNTQPWTTIETLYDAGQITQRTTEFDDGITRVEAYAAGRITSHLDTREPQMATTPEDPAPNPNHWIAREAVYDASGTITHRKSETQDGDTTAVLYENGRITEQHLVDGDNDQAWIARKLFYGADGRVSDTLEFYAFDDLPSDFILPVIMVDDAALPAGIAPGGTLVLGALEFPGQDLFIFHAGPATEVPEPILADTITIVAPGLAPVVPSGPGDDLVLPDDVAPVLGDIMVTGGHTGPVIVSSPGITLTGVSGATPNPNAAPSDAPSDSPPPLEDVGLGTVTGNGLTQLGGGSGSTPVAVSASFEPEPEEPSVFDFA